jgi:hypothetical protein
MNSFEPRLNSSQLTGSVCAQPPRPPRSPVPPAPNSLSINHEAAQQLLSAIAAKARSVNATLERGTGMQASNPPQGFGV